MHTGPTSSHGQSPTVAMCKKSCMLRNIAHPPVCLRVRLFPTLRLQATHLCASITASFIPQDRACAWLHDLLLFDVESMLQALQILRTHLRACMPAHIVGCLVVLSTQPVPGRGASQREDTAVRWHAAHGGASPLNTVSFVSRSSQHHATCW